MSLEFQTDANAVRQFERYQALAEPGRYAEAGIPLLPSAYCPLPSTISGRANYL